jgi:cytoskeletal protein CcmA (bactofilin family)
MANESNAPTAGLAMFFRRFSKPNSNDNAPPSKPAVTTIANGTEFDGNLTTSGEVHVNGILLGTISAQVCIVETNGAVEGEISADEIIVRGRVAGPLRAYHVHLQSGAQVEGDVISDTIAVDSGASLNGSVRRNEDPFAQEAVVEPSRPGGERPSFLGSPLWISSEADAFRPLTAVRPR